MLHARPFGLAITTQVRQGVRQFFTQPLHLPRRRRGSVVAAASHSQAHLSCSRSRVTLCRHTARLQPRTRRARTKGPPLDARPSRQPMLRTPCQAPPHPALASANGAAPWGQRRSWGGPPRFHGRILLAFQLCRPIPCVRPGRPLSTCRSRHVPHFVLRSSSLQSLQARVQPGGVDAGALTGWADGAAPLRRRLRRIIPAVWAFCRRFQCSGDSLGVCLRLWIEALPAFVIIVGPERRRNPPHHLRGGGLFERGGGKTPLQFMEFFISSEPMNLASHSLSSFFGFAPAAARNASIARSRSGACPCELAHHMAA